MNIRGCGARDVPVTWYLVVQNREPKPISLERFEHISYGYNTEPLIADSSGIVLCEECIQRLGLRPFETMNESSASGLSFWVSSQWETRQFELSEEVRLVLECSPKLECAEFKDADIYSFVKHLNEASCEECRACFRQMNKDLRTMKLLSDFKGSNIHWSGATRVPSQAAPRGWPLA